ncbi:ABC transporter permease [Phytoactinopolyspora halotolerans]|uniref:ABC transporter permease n=1 Tax=Phytoactinopolyspora halotolerans TaxID=1981512 RepID=A0A6L9S844_9ACTN|nr:ABC transporter permease [Phytoactinopolyspora halotolerans]NEE01366.1 ABC transporter permease [Phytoactinopolyspora halotolerans]
MTQPFTTGGPSPLDGPGLAADAESALDRDEQELALASQWKLIWWGFKKHRLAFVCGIITVLIYLVAVFAPFLAPYSSSAHNADYTYAPPQGLNLFDDGSFSPHVNGYTYEQDPETLALTFTLDEESTVPIGFFVKGEEYKLLGFIPWDRHLIGPKDYDGQPMYLLGADSNGRDVLSRIIHGTTVSMSIGLVGVLLSLFLGVVLGGISGYFGGKIDTAIQRLIEFIIAIPTIPLWMALFAAVPDGWSQIQRYFALTVVISLVGWVGMAREVRGKFYAVRSDDYVTAAIADGAGQTRVMFRHMLPSFTSHIIANLSLSIPTIILAETALSFIGLGLQPPTVSWGVLLQEAQNIRAVSTAPWILIPGIAVVITVLAMNFFGDGLRDAADPYKN